MNKDGSPDCCGALECPPDRDECTCGWIGTCLEIVRKKYSQLMLKRGNIGGH